MHFERTAIDGLVIVHPEVHRDERGEFFEVVHAEKFACAGLPARFVQDNHSISAARVLRGLHGQLHHPQGKLVRVVRGAIFDVAVDLRPRSPTFRRWLGLELSEENRRQLAIPPGFLHGFCVLGDGAEVEYKCTELYAPGDEFGVIWNDPDLGIDWPIEDPILSPKDAALPPLSEVIDTLPDAAP